MRRGPGWFWLAALLWLLPCLARADVQRFALVVGNNLGDEGEPALRYAESDAARIHEVMGELGGFAPANMVLLQGQSARTVEETLIILNERVRNALAQEGTQALLFVYYSGHADEESFHLAGTRMPVRLLSQLVGGSAATFRLLVLDACRSGELTRKKGGRITPPTTLLSGATLPGQGMAVLAASAAHEDAQESDEIRASFFTHALVSGLMGAADQDADGAVSLSEAYQYAYEATLRASSRTQFGSQHPTFRFDFAGQGAVILTEPQGHVSSRGVLAFPPGVGFLILRGDATGAVVGELGRHDARRSMSVKPGPYFVRGRGPDVLYEGSVAARAGITASVDLQALTRTEYARLVRKGGTAAPERSNLLAAGAWLRTRLPNAKTPCLGGFLGYAVEFEHLGLEARAGGCTARFETEHVDAVVNEYDLELRLNHTWDWSWLSLQLGLGAGGALFTQRFESERSAPPRDSFSPYLLVHGGLSVPIRRLQLGVNLAGETHFLPLQSASTLYSPEFAARASALLGLGF